MRENVSPRRLILPKPFPANGSVAFVLSVFMFTALPAAPAELRVGGPGGGYTGIGNALADADEGDTILVSAGEYHENLRIEKPIVLRGEGDARLVGLGRGDVISVLADDVTIEGLRVSGSGSMMISSDAGIKIYGARDRIKNNRLFDNLFGIYLKGAREALVDSNHIEGRRAVDLGRRGAGIHLYDAHRNVIRENRVSYVRDGVYFDHANFNLVERNDFSHLRYGVHYMYCEDNSFFDNVFRDSLGGVALMYTERVTFRGNQILNNREGYNAFGLLLKDCLDSVAERNVIVNNVNGVFLDNSHHNHFRNNLVAYNDVGIMLYASSLENGFSGNDFIGNLATLHTVGRAEERWTENGVGNYYSDYKGYDLDDDGVGDVPHRLQDAFEYLTGRRPLASLFLTSAAADALAAAERSFPIVPSSDEEDTAPRMKPSSGVRVDLGALEGSGEAKAKGLYLAAGSLVALALSAGLAWRFRR